MTPYVLKKLQKLQNKYVAPFLHAHRLRKEREIYLKSGASETYRQGKDDFALYRILGNDLPPRHRPGQTLANLEFCLEHEPEFEDCQKWWVVNRIFDEARRREIIACLDSYKQNYFTIDFEPDDYACIENNSDVAPYLDGSREPLDEKARNRAVLAALRPKILYAINNNGARNAALEHGRKRAKWILPFDGNCMISGRGWRDIRQTAKRSTTFPYHIVPMHRLTENDTILDEHFTPDCGEEPQIMFHKLSGERFDPRLPYGRSPKAELLMRLGVRGPWDHWEVDPWDIPPAPFCAEWGRFVMSDGWVGRLYSGNVTQETGRKSSVRRMANRDDGILRAIEELDKRYGSHGAGLDI